MFGEDGRNRAGPGVDPSVAEVTVLESAPLEGTKPVHFRGTWTDNPSENATVSWSTAKPAEKYLIKYRVQENVAVPNSCASSNTTRKVPSSTRRVLNRGIQPVPGCGLVAGVCGPLWLRSDGSVHESL